MTPGDLARAVRELPTTAAKIRALAAKGQSRADIARILGIRYQHVRNVLLRDEEKMKAAEGTMPADAAMPGKIPVAPDGSVAPTFNHNQCAGAQRRRRSVCAYS